jgi:hypothetical protein
MVQEQLGQIVRSNLQNSQSKVDWRCGSSGRALQAQSLEFELQSYQKKKKRKKEMTKYIHE